MEGEIIIWIVFAICLALSFLFSGMEAGVFALSRLRIRQRMRAGQASAKVLYDFLEHPENFLWTILVGNTLANFLILGWLIVLLARALGEHDWWFALVYAVIVFLFYSFSDLLPKMLFRAYPNRLSLLLARPFRVVHLALRPLVTLAEWCSGMLLRWSGEKAFTGHLFGNREELLQVMQESAQGLTSEERTMINRVLDLQSLTVRQVMKPIAKAASLAAQQNVQDALGLCRKSGFTRLPVWEERDRRKRIIGLVSCNALLYQPEVDPARPVRDFVRPALYLEEDLRLEVALRRLQRGGQRLAIVLGREGSEIGILSLQDVLNSVFGQVSL